MLFKLAFVLSFFGVVCQQNLSCFNCFGFFGSISVLLSAFLLLYFFAFFIYYFSDLMW